MTTTDTSDATVPLACDLSAIAPGERSRHEEVAATLFAAVAEARDLPDGRAFRLPPDSRHLILAAEFIARERLCCPFFAFALELAPAGGPLWLRLTGPDGAQAILAAELGHLLPAADQ